MIDSDLLPLLAALVAGTIAAVVLMNRPPPPGGKPRGRAAMGAACLLVLSLAGCANPLNSARLVVGSAADLYNATEPRLEAQEKAQLDACLSPAVEASKRPSCVEGVVTSWAPVKAALASLDAAIAAARFGLLAASASDAAGKPVDAAEVERLVLAVLTAASALQSAVAPTAAPSPAPAPSVTPSAHTGASGGASP